MIKQLPSITFPRQKLDEILSHPLQDTEDFDNAIHQLRMYREKYEALVKKDSSYLPYLAATYNNIARYQQQSLEHSSAAQSYAKAMELYLDLYKKDPIEYKPFLASTYHGMGILFSEMSNKEEAYLNYVKAQALYTELANEFPQMYEPYLSTVLHNIGTFFDDQMEFQKALEYYYEALAIRQDLVEKNPGLFTSDMASTGIKLIHIYHALSDNEPKPVYREKAMELLVEILKRVNEVPGDLAALNNIKSQLKYYTNYFTELADKEGFVIQTLQKAERLIEEWQAATSQESKTRVADNMLDMMTKTQDLFPAHQGVKEFYGIALDMVRD